MQPIAARRDVAHGSCSSSQSVDASMDDGSYTAQGRSFDTEVNSASTQEESRLILENITKYGLRTNPLTWLHRAFGSSSSNRYTLAGFLILFLCSITAWAIEYIGSSLLRREQRIEVAARKKQLKSLHIKLKRARSVTDLVMSTLHGTFSVFTPLAVPLAISYFTSPDPLPLAALTFLSITICMKLLSYAMCNAEFRLARRAKEFREGERGVGITTNASKDVADANCEVLKPTLAYPENLSLPNLLYFLAAPTLVYQMEYPRTKRIRKWWLLRRIVELAVFMGLMVFLVDQYVEPAILNSLGKSICQVMDKLQVPLVDSQPVLVVERVLKLSLPCIYVWLTMFYLFFHVWLNVVAEITYFADREFYKDWWNANTIGEYWRLWNMPVHNWMVRCIYVPVVNACGSKTLAGIAVFFVSGILHEMAVGVPLRMIRYWAFAGMLAQVPMIFITEHLKRRFKNEVVGNIIFWLSFCIIGQPICALLYYHDYLLEHAPQYLDGLKKR